MVDALTSDCRVLLARFEEKHSVRFETFCEVWKQMNFSVIHYTDKLQLCSYFLQVINAEYPILSARTREWEKIQIVECLFRILSNYLSSTCPLQYQVGAIYAIYSIYNTQLVKPKVKVRMTMSAWNDLLELQEKVKEQKHYDVYYVISSLRTEKAFIFVAMPIQLACGSRDAISVYERELSKESKPSSAVQSVLETLTRVGEIDSSYNSIKMKICTPGDGKPMVDPVTLRVASDDLVFNLESDVSEFEMWKKTNKEQLKVKQMPRPPELGLPDDRKEASDLEKEGPKKLSRVQRVRAIKDRSYKTITQVSKSKRHHQPAAEKTKRRRSKRKHGKSRK